MRPVRLRSLICRTFLTTLGGLQEVARSCTSRPATSFRLCSYDPTGPHRNPPRGIGERIEPAWMLGRAMLANSQLAKGVSRLPQIT